MSVINNGLVAPIVASDAITKRKLTSERGTYITLKIMLNTLPTLSSFFIFLTSQLKYIIVRDEKQGE